MMLYDLAETGWAKNLTKMVDTHRETWIVRSFMRRLATGAFMRESLTRHDEADILALIADLHARDYKWRSEIERKAHIAKIEQRLRQQKALERLHPSKSSSELDVSSDEH